jgi:hypothetical protein
MLISKAFYRHLPIFLNISKCPVRGLICGKTLDPNTPWDTECLRLA